MLFFCDVFCREVTILRICRPKISESCLDVCGVGQKTLVCFNNFNRTVRDSSQKFNVWPYFFGSRSRGNFWSAYLKTFPLAIFTALLKRAFAFFIIIKVTFRHRSLESIPLFIFFITHILNILVPPDRKVFWKAAFGLRNRLICSRANKFCERRCGLINVVDWSDG